MSNGHACVQTRRLLALERDGAAVEAKLRERHEEILETMGKIAEELAGIQATAKEHLEELHKSFDARFRAAFARIEALTKMLKPGGVRSWSRR